MGLRAGVFEIGCKGGGGWEDLGGARIMGRGPAWAPGGCAKDMDVVSPGIGPPWPDRPAACGGAGAPEGWRGFAECGLTVKPCWGLEVRACKAESGGRRALRFTMGFMGPELGSNCSWLGPGFAGGPPGGPMGGRRVKLAPKAFECMGWDPPGPPWKGCCCWLCSKGLPMS